MRAMKTTLLASCLVFAVGCAPAAEVPFPTLPSFTPATQEAPLTSCAMELPDGARHLQAVGAEVLLGLDDGSVLRGAGSGCALEWTRSEVVGELMDVDAAGNLYVLADDGFQQRRFPDLFGDLVARLTPEGDASAVVSAGRGIWSFGVSPSGQTMWVTACGPTGVLQTKDLAPAMTAAPPWEAGHATLTTDHELWMSRPDRCDEQGCSLVLTRTTPAGEVQVRALGVIDAPLMHRCEAGPCVAGARAVQQLDHDGALLREWTSERLALGDGEALLDFALTDRGLYVLRTGVEGQRLAFTPLD